MGKALVIRGADFSANRIEQVDLGLYLDKNVTKFGFTYMGSFTASESWGISCGTTVWPGGKVIIVDVSDYVGKQVEIYITQLSLSSAGGSIVRGRIGFVSDLGGETLSDLISMEPENDRTKVCEPTLVSLVQESPLAQDDYHTYIKTIPAGAKYLIMAYFSPDMAVGLDDVYVKVLD